jgi:poly(beta-D-mannuronate) lyase
VHDPNASFLNVPARRAALQSATNPRVLEAIAGLKTCIGAPVPQPPPDSQFIPGRYKSGSHGALNPREHILSLPYIQLQELATRGADRYLLTGDPREANCVLDALSVWAQAKALTAYDTKENRQLSYVAEWTVTSLSLTVSIFRNDPALDPVKRDQVIVWLRKAAHKVINSAEALGEGAGRNNHFYWRGLAAISTGIVSKDDDLYQTGLRTYATAMGQIDANGAFPLEMQRHELALHYQAFAIAPLVMIAELARRQGIDLYTLQENHHQLGDAVAFFIRALHNPSVIRQYTTEEQENGMDSGSSSLAWIEYWNLHSPDPAWQPYLQKPFRDNNLGGSTTLLAAPVGQPAPPVSTMQSVP